ncbi:PHP domain-containing protein [Clostridium tagluense]|uniref:PHP domain-containing protein n=1 Tax=Clostridium tagluense TaxID=360422 RepID=UPI001CF152FE|nr:PHP domain-containing protein [Clostridium tagluense]MCB2310620.1 PHP domain-containing protein [Clostridium tagluense]MCB2315649.1 PHP domain-containing protein [Clostridium tagluense]MCB2320503.1 PHP domain-containing protein [Clostridium tagluense]MCB2325214.1 PHP domain-containing protein [Clostridium tagluense]MCB2330066.1 PHP domain-containing protein [Clostridium tagluense]
MKKIDLHIHTKATISDVDFEFSLETLKEYVEKSKLDCIAITNHNLFEYEQFLQIKENLDIDVLPGIEINIETGHLLLISKNSELLNFKEKCDRVKDLIVKNTDNISVEMLKDIYGELSKYLLIPHYDKKPACSEKVIKELSEYVVAGEVNSIKKFLYCQRDNTSLTPVYFSDIRIKKNLSVFSPRQTYLDIDEISIEAIKLCLDDKNKVQLSSENGHKIFQILDNGLNVSTGLTVILGARSSGKSFTLDEISKNYENVKYIKQFALLEKDDKKDTEKFNNLLATKQSSITEEYLKEFKAVVEDVSDIDLANDGRCIENYIDSLLKNANETQRDDAFSRAVLFNEVEYTKNNLDNLKKVINATQTLVDNLEYKETINRYLPEQNIYRLLIDLMKQYEKSCEENLKREHINEIIKGIKNKLRLKTAATVIDDVDFNKVILDREKVNKFTEIVSLIKKECKVQEKEAFGFKVVAKASRFNGASELRSLSGRQQGFSNAYSKYDNPYDYLQELNKIEIIPCADYYKYFTSIKFRVLNKYGVSVSGGERSEFNLLNEINNAMQADMLLLDEPESSFDNLFLKNSVNETIKDLSRHIPVIVVTHNSTVGASIKPDYIVFTKKKIEGDNMSYELYSGYPSNKILRNLSGKELSNHNILLNCLEAGESAYQERGRNYEILET